ncbi:MAG TPA: efflux RND transporter periplasmic adaptor subunit [Polyangiaceae bacterium LLY-WYZ-15_(1-7)]|nr:efflux RND transporter periplasmic adaptor subunit [Polyangiaceae bacterium LLY-WYZ-15_(1-7)]HJL04641.1 efflux RND transporter periplasmic adaptor subunit [Polyangiaceae bacterium LLY-WYZ-15_(1-7)]HJL07423.1 efflux RND transporter periplasmic adaptor subunit [Polyangiaceae bacterium LLY-WYZ-15_(1-7)]HJL22189.1 efflux RND transporter periplasmic adaptor subunit [Polyangiaceae bacterium LLY-WYZ-15_(1-7)]
MRRLSLLSIFLLACGGDSEPGAGGGAGSGGPPPARVEVAPARMGALEATRTYYAELRSLERAELAAGAEGEVREVRVRVGDRVSRGDLLLVVDPDRARASLAAARSARERAERERAQALRDAERLRRAGRELVPEAEIEQTEARAAQLEAEVENQSALVAEARDAMDRTRLRAPFDGTVAARHVDRGDWVSAGTLAFEVVADEGVEAIVRVEPELTPQLEADHPVRFLHAGESVSGRVSGVVHALDPATRTAGVRALPAEATPWLRPGAAAEVAITVERDGEGVVVPRDALVFGVAETRVFEVVDGKAEARPVEVLDRGGAEVRVRAEGLEAGDRVVVRGNERLRPGQPVQVQGDEAESADADGNGADEAPAP